jgi:hypothetical protein
MSEVRLKKNPFDLRHGYTHGFEYVTMSVVCGFLIINLVGSIAYAQTSRIGNIVDNFLIPIPEPDGICFDGTSFWVPNRAADYGPQRIYKIDVWTHKITDSIPAPAIGPDGIAWDGVSLWVRGWDSTNTYNAMIHLSTSGQVLGYIHAVGSCYWAGVAWDGRNLYYGTNVCFASPAGQKSMIYKVNPTNGAVIDSFPPPTGNINGLVYDRGNLWYCDDNNGYIFKIDTTGNILYEFPLSGLTFHGPLSGLAIAKGYLWAVDMAGVGGRRIYEIDIGETPAIPQLINCYANKEKPGKIELGWLASSSPNVREYKIYRDGPLTYGFGDLTAAVLIDSVPSNNTTYIDSTMPNGFPFAYWVSAVDSEGVESHASNGLQNAAWPEFEFKLGQNYPNPFNPTTTIPYEVTSLSSPRTRVTIVVYDILGRKVATLVDKNETIGDKTLRFNAGNLPSGIYLYRMQAPGFSQTKKMVLIR